ncbi:uncharacterized protein LOC126175081 isoform X1 [Schistocerca cancellata]|uniref:uncharacterized protein LOC126175081 isoform X1 n=1 Tax=Schistocerca cancellata TaxID=274614 RepID=UPI0021197513|nr:uncharacterized protein LOC126175081 isoform X1 [Schistocerca cancellata]
MSNWTVKKVCPLPSELSGIKKNIPCPEEGCSGTFLNTSNLDMHLSKHHKKANIDLLKKGDSQTIFQYHCPVEKCLYNMKSDRFFKNMKYLKQHYLKVHAEKMYLCEKCHKGFSTETAQRKHMRTCGMKFTCSCNFSYESYEALLTHAKRHRHTFDEKFRFYGKSNAVPNEAEVSSKDMPRPFAVPIHPLAAATLSELSPHSVATTVSRAVQTDRVAEAKRTRKSGVHPKASKRKTCAQTQTGSIPRNRHPTTSAETQTIGDYILKKAMKAADIPVSHRGVSVPELKTETTAKKRRKSMETQTTQPVANSVFSKCNDVNISISTNGFNNNQMYNHTEDSIPGSDNFTALNNSPTPNFSLFDGSDSFSLDIDSLSSLWQKSSSGTQTSPVSTGNILLKEEMLNHSVTQTDWNNVLLESKPFTHSSSNINSSSQTVSDLSTYFENPVETGFIENANETNHFSSPSCSTELNGVPEFPGDSNYSDSNLDSILTQTAGLFDENWSCSTETQTELDFNSCFFNDDDTSFTHYFNTETQTSEDVDNLGQLLYSNTCTQTNDINKLSEFADIQTQTAGPHFSKDSVLISAETQTAISETSNSQICHSSKQLVSNKPSAATVFNDNDAQTNGNEFKDFIIDLVKRDMNDKLL